LGVIIGKSYFCRRIRNITYTYQYLHQAVVLNWQMVFTMCYGFILLLMNTPNSFHEIGFANLDKKERV